MQYARRLIESRPLFERIPDQALLASGPGASTGHIQATRATDGSYALIYTAAGAPVTVDLSKLSGSHVVAHWYDPRRGSYIRVGEFATGALQEFRPPTSGSDHDWVLVLDDTAQGFPQRGSPKFLGPLSTSAS